MLSRFASRWRCQLFAVLVVVGVFAPTARGGSIEIVGINIVPHTMAPDMLYRRDPDPRLGARIQLMARNASSLPLTLETNAQVLLNGRSIGDLTRLGELAWHDLPEAWPTPVVLAPGAITVWNLNGTTQSWRPGNVLAIEVSDLIKTNLPLAPGEAVMTAVTFLGPDNTPQPDRVVIHVENQSSIPLKPVALTLWLPASNERFRELLPKRRLSELTVHGARGTIGQGDKGIVEGMTGELPLTYTVAQLEMESPNGDLASVWAHLRIKKEQFDISGGWVGGETKGKSALTFEPFLKTLKSLHINTGHIADTPGYTDQDGPGGLYAKYPLKYFNKLQPLDHYDTDRLLPRIHAVEFLGEPQYGGGRPVPPMTVWKELSVYAASRLATTVTHSEERIWRDYAGLSDYPHYDAYRVGAPSPDAWRRYDRWGGPKIGWGAPLETIGSMTRSLRDLNRPMPIAYWSQGPHAGWRVYDGRRRTSPTPDELRLQAWHGLAQRITSLYWFNLSWESLTKFPDLIPEMRRIGREIRMLEELFLEGDAYEYRRTEAQGRPSWDLASIATSRAMLLVALDLDYKADLVAREFRFGAPRHASLRFKLPPWLAKPVNIHRVDASGIYDCEYYFKEGAVEIRERLSRVGLFVVAGDPGVAAELHQKRKALIDMEKGLDFDPGENAADLDLLRRGP